MSPIDLDNLYPYADDNRIKNPNLYMYAPLYGTNFFSAYINSRNDALIRLCNGTIKYDEIKMPEHIIHLIDKILVINHKLFPISQNVYPLIKGMLLLGEERKDEMLPELLLKQDSNNVRTQDIFNVLLYRPPPPPPPRNGNQCIYNLLNFYTSRFEITKKLYEKYSFLTNKGEGSYEALELYASLALILGELCFCEGNLRYFNTLLKLNDLLCSLINELNGKSVVMTTFSILLEMACSSKILDAAKKRNADTP